MALPASSSRRDSDLREMWVCTGGGTDVRAGRPPEGRAPQAAGHQEAATRQAPVVAAGVEQEMTVGS
jgi:hypothetical protein